MWVTINSYFVVCYWRSKPKTTKGSSAGSVLNMWVQPLWAGPDWKAWDHICIRFQVFFFFFNKTKVCADFIDKASPIQNSSLKCSEIQNLLRSTMLRKPRVSEHFRRGRSTCTSMTLEGGCMSAASLVHRCGWGGFLWQSYSSFAV